MNPRLRLSHYALITFAFVVVGHSLRARAEEPKTRNGEALASNPATADWLKRDPVLEMLAESQRFAAALLNTGKHPFPDDKDAPATRARRTNTPWTSGRWVRHWTEIMQREETATQYAKTLIASFGGNLDEIAPRVRATLSNSLYFYFAVDGDQDAMLPPVNTSRGVLWEMLAPADQIIWKGGANWHLSSAWEIARPGTDVTFLPRDTEKALISDPLPERFGKTLKLSPTDFSIFRPKEGTFVAIEIGRKKFQLAVRAVLKHQTVDFAQRYLKHWDLNGEARARAQLAFGEQFLQAHESRFLSEASSAFTDAIESAGSDKTRRLAADRLRYATKLEWMLLDAALKQKRLTSEEAQQVRDKATAKAAMHRKQLAAFEGLDPMAPWSVTDLLRAARVASYGDVQEVEAFSAAVLRRPAKHLQSGDRVEALIHRAGAALVLGKMDAARKDCESGLAEHVVFEKIAGGKLKEVFPEGIMPKDMMSARPDLVLQRERAEEQARMLSDLKTAIENRDR